MASRRWWQCATVLGCLLIGPGLSAAQTQTQARSRPTTPAVALTRSEDVCVTPPPPTTGTTGVSSLVSVRQPAVRLRSHHGPPVEWASSLDEQRPVLLNFVFTSCTTVCPPMSQIFAALQERLGPFLYGDHAEPSSDGGGFNSPVSRQMTSSSQAHA